jgi:hypothetical protein
MFKNPAPERKYCNSITKINDLLLLFREIITVYSEYHKTHENGVSLLLQQTKYIKSLCLKGLTFHESLT